MRARAALTLAVAAALCAAPAAEGKTYRFKADVFIQQSAYWAAWLTSYPCKPEGRQGWESHRRILEGSGGGFFKAKQNGLTITFRDGPGGVASDPFALKSVTQDRSATFKARYDGAVPENCTNPVKDRPVDTSTCGTNAFSSKLRTWTLMTPGGRLTPFGAPEDRFEGKCPDPSRWLTVFYGGGSKRKDVHRLIRDKKVRKIELSGPGGFFDPKGLTTGWTQVALSKANAFHETYDDSSNGNAVYRWRIKLTRTK